MHDYVVAAFGFVAGFLLGIMYKKNQERGRDKKYELAAINANQHQAAGIAANAAAAQHQLSSKSLRMRLRRNTFMLPHKCAAAPKQ